MDHWQVYHQNSQPVFNCVTHPRWIHEFHEHPIDILPTKPSSPWWGPFHPRCICLEPKAFLTSVRETLPSAPAKVWKACLRRWIVGMLQNPVFLMRKYDGINYCKDFVQYELLAVGEFSQWCLRNVCWKPCRLRQRKRLTCILSSPMWTLKN